MRCGRGPGALVSARGTGTGRDWVELVATLLLALATVATAWSGYQSTRWNGEQAKAGARASALRIESAKLAGVANAQTVADVSVFTNWVAFPKPRAHVRFMPGALPVAAPNSG